MWLSSAGHTETSASVPLQEALHRLRHAEACLQEARDSCTKAAASVAPPLPEHPPRCPRRPPRAKGRAGGRAWLSRSPALGADRKHQRECLSENVLTHHDLLAAVKRYITLRKHYAAVWRGGAYVHLYAQGRVYVFARQRDRHTVMVGLNAGTREAKLDLDVHRLFPNGVHVRAEWSDQQYTVIDDYVRGLSIPARDGCVWVGERPS
jgi:hypothetical protein